MKCVPDNMAEEYRILTEHIPTGEIKAIPMASLCIILNTKPSELKELVCDARKDGVLICSSSAGYFFPSGLMELRKYNRTVMKHIHTSKKAIQPFLDVETDMVWDEKDKVATAAYTDERGGGG